MSQRSFPYNYGITKYVLPLSIVSQIRFKSSHNMLLHKRRHLPIFDGLASIGFKSYCTMGCVLPEHDTHIDRFGGRILTIVHDCVLACVGHLNTLICCHFADWSDIFRSFCTLAMLVFFDVCSAPWKFVLICKTRMIHRDLSCTMYFRVKHHE